MKISASACQNATGLGSRCVEVTAILGASGISLCETPAPHLGRCLATRVPGRRLAPPAWWAGQHPESKWGALAVGTLSGTVGLMRLCGAEWSESVWPAGEGAAGPRCAARLQTMHPAKQTITGSREFTSELRDFIPLEGGKNGAGNFTQNRPKREGDRSF